MKQPSSFCTAASEARHGLTPESPTCARHAWGQLHCAEKMSLVSRRGLHGNAHVEHQSCQQCPSQMSALHQEGSLQAPEAYVRCTSTTAKCRQRSLLLARHLLLDPRS